MLVSGAMPTWEMSARKNRLASTATSGAVARRHVEAVGAGDARAVEQRADLQRIARVARAEHPEIGEGRELLGLAEAGLEGQAARRDAEARVAGDRPEVAGAEEGQQLLRDAALLEQVVDPKAGEARILGGKRLGDLDLAEVEQRRIVEDLARVARPRPDETRTG